MENFGYIYKTTNLVNGKIYIGQHIGNKFLSSYKGSGKALLDALKKYGKENFKTELLEWCFDFEQLNDRERYWISFYNSRELETGYNLSPGGQDKSFLGCKHTSESNQKNSKTKKDQKLHWWTNSEIQKLSAECPGENWKLGRLPTTQNTKNKIKNTFEKKKYKFYTNGIENLYVAEDEIIPEGFKLGFNNNKPEDWREHLSEYNKANSSCKGKQRSYETCIKISNKLKNRKCYTDGKVVIRLLEGETVPEGFKEGILPISDETREKLSNANKGKKRSEDSRRKNSLAHIGKKPSNCKKVRCLNTNKIYLSLTECFKDTGISVYYIAKSCNTHIEVGELNLMFQWEEKSI